MELIPALRAGAVALGLGLVAAGELGLRLLAPTESLMELLPIHGADGAAALGERLDLEVFLGQVWSLFERDRLLVWRLAPELELDAGGLSIAAGAPAWRLSTDASGRRRGGADGGLVALGDSSTFGWGVDDDQCWPSLAGGVNLAVPGYSSAQGRIQAARRLPELDARALVMAYGANDGHYTPATDRELLARRATAVGGLSWRLSGLQLVRRLRNLIYGARLGAVMARHRQGETRPRVSPEGMAENLSAIAALAPQASVLLLAVCVRDDYRGAMRSLAQSRGWGLVEYGGETLDGCHPDAAGHRWIAAQIGERLSATHQ